MPLREKKQLTSPSAMGYAMPAEWEKHEATWLGWPHNASDWPGEFEVIPGIYGEMVRKISAAEKDCLGIRNPADETFARRVFKHVGVDLRQIRFITHPTNRGWTRDTGPIFVKHRKESAIVHFHFNGWAKYNNWRRDTKVPETAAKLLRKKLFHAECGGKPFVIEGGGIELNGRGTLISTEEC